MALSFQTGGRYVKMTQAVSATQSFTHMCRFYLPTIALQVQGIMEFNSDPAGGVAIDSNGKIGFFINQEVAVLDGPAAVAKVWTTVATVTTAVSSSNHTMLCYVNGQRVLTQADATTTYFGSTEIDLPNSSFQTLGYVRDYRMWSRALTDQEVALEYRSPTPHTRAGLLVWSPFDKDTNRNLAPNNKLWTTVGGAAVLVGLGGTNQIKRVRRRAL